MASSNDILTNLTNIIIQQQATINSIASHLEQLESIGGGSASINDYEVNKKYKRNTLIVDTNTETVYRVLIEYTSVNIDTDKTNGYIKLVGYESQVVTFAHNPSQAEIDTIPDDSLVAIYSTADKPYFPDK